MRKIKLLIEYEGTNYAGWQRQNPRTEGRGVLFATANLPQARQYAPTQTIQQTIEEAIQQITREKVVLYGASRTDAGVHAVGQVAHFMTSHTISTSRLPRAINAHLPRDIAIKLAEEVSETFHAQYDAKSKSYRYTLFNERVRCALNRNFCYHFPIALDITLMQEAASHLLGTHDFQTFQTHAYTKKTTVRTMSAMEIKKEDGFIYFILEADGFLYNMARAIVGTLIEVGRGKMTPDRFKHILDARDRRLAGDTAPAKGLCLMEIKY